MARKRKTETSNTAAAADTESASSAAGADSAKDDSAQADNEDDVHPQSDSDDSDSSSDDSLVLEGELIRNPDVDSSDDDSVSSGEGDSKSDDPEPTKKKAKQQKTDSKASKAKKKSAKPNNEPETIQVEFQFCDMNEKFFHGIKTLLHRHGIHTSHSSQLADLIIENISVGTVLSTDYTPDNTDSKPSASSTPNDEPNVFGFASVINLTTHNSNPSITALKQLCLKHCPSEHKSEFETVLSGKTKRPAGFFFHERMVNIPLEITEVLHQQLVLDMDWAVQNAHGGEEERKALDFGAFVRMAPCYNSNGNVIYKYFDDEVFASNAEFVYSFDMPKLYEADEEEGVCSVIVLTKTGHRAAMKELGKMIGGN